MLPAVVKFRMIDGTLSGKFKWAAEFLFCPVSVITFSIAIHGKSSFTDRIAYWENFRIFGIPFTIRRKQASDVKATAMGDDKIVAQVVNQFRDHRESFTFHNDKSIYYGMVRKSFTAGIWILRNNG